MNKYQEIVESTRKYIDDNIECNVSPDAAAQGLKWAFDKVPIFEDDDDEIGCTLFFPVSNKNINRC